MKALKQIGFKKTVRFVFFSFLQVFYHHTVNHFLFFPPFRKLFLQVVGAKVGKDSILMDVKFFNWHYRGPGGLKIGDKCFIGDETLIDLYDDVILENHVTLAQRVSVLTHTNVGYKDHPLQKYFPKISKGVIFKKGSVIGAGAIILPGVTIGERSFVGAGSVVTSDVPQDSLFAGVPAKLIRKIK